MKAHPQKFWFVKNLGKISKYLSTEISTFFNNVNKIILFVIERINKSLSCDRKHI